MTGRFHIIMSLLYIFVLPVNLIDSVMVLVNVCPNNEHDVLQASNRLGCGNDRYGNNQYLCLPNKDKSSLVEFCFQGVMGIVEKGNCREFSEGKLVHHSCNQFLYGCPDTHFYDRDIYKYPACQNISIELRCYVLDPNCTDHSNPEQSSDQNNVIYAISITGGVLVLIVCFIIIMLCCKWRRAMRKKIIYDDQKVTDESETPLTGNKDESKVNFGQEIPLSDIENDIRIVLIGKTGSGKSATGNTILGIKHFRSSLSWTSITSQCSQKSVDRFGHKILIVNTPGLFDTTQFNKDFQKELTRCIRFTMPGPHAFILVLPVARYTREEHEFVQNFVDIFGGNILQYVIVLFTRKDDLDEDGKTLDDHIKCVPATLQTLIENCGRRVIAFNNRLNGDEGDEQVRELLSMILKNVKQNNSECYRNEMYEEAERLLRENEEEIRRKAQMERDKKLQDMKNLLAEELSKEAENN